MERALTRADFMILVSMKPGQRIMLHGCRVIRIEGGWTVDGKLCCCESDLVDALSQEA